ncbi:myomodulin neuropeptides 1-like [Aplysia californica]|uniref:Myomodulin neuropeptides 1-like n=1 Tax=Aplysia californica TaxID=6500 RepID=A0ABM0JR01_APLCA|nr:myomodulin neuropeptides 1-like [Aplysia californica]
MAAVRPTLSYRAMAIPLLLCVVCFMSFCPSAILAEDDASTVKATSPADVTDSAESREKRASNFVRIGRPSSFVRIGKDVGGDGSFDENDAGQQDYLRDDPYADEMEKKASSFVRIGRGSNLPLHRFIRIGRMSDYGSYVDDHYNRMYGDEPEAEKRKSHFVRIGKRPSSFVRIGRSGDEVYDDASEDQYDNKRASSFVRIGKTPVDQLASLKDAIKRASHFVRIGKAPSNFVRIGRNPSSFVRIGRNPSSFVRIGKSELPDDEDFAEKRASSFVRIGKNIGYDLGSSLGYDDLSPADFNSQDMLKRASSFVRIGKSGDGEDKRASSFVRIGKSGDNSGPHLSVDGTDDGQKRASSFVRIGKSGMDNAADGEGALSSDKRASNFVRIGKALSSPGAPAQPSSVGSSSSMSSLSSPSSSSSHSDSSSSEESLGDGVLFDDDKPISVASRAHAFVRIGKIPSSAFVRIGKNSDVMVEPALGRRAGYRRGSRGGQSSFVRIGK